MNKKAKILINGIIKENPIFVLLLGMYLYFLIHCLFLLR